MGGGGYQIISTGTFADRSNEAQMKTPGSIRQQKQTREADAAVTPGGLKNSSAATATDQGPVENLSNELNSDSAARQQNRSTDNCCTSRGACQEGIGEWEVENTQDEMCSPDPQGWGLGDVLFSVSVFQKVGHSALPTLRRQVCL